MHNHKNIGKTVRKLLVISLIINTIQIGFALIMVGAFFAQITQIDDYRPLKWSPTTRERNWTDSLTTTWSLSTLSPLVWPLLGFISPGIRRSGIRSRRVLGGDGEKDDPFLFCFELSIKPFHRQFSTLVLCNRPSNILRSFHLQSDYPWPYYSHTATN